MRLIDADALNEKFGCQEKCDGCEFHGPDNFCNIDEIPLFEVCYAINFAPTIDAVPVVHGHWKEDDGRVRVCSVCDTDWCHKDEMDFEQYFNYCPNCGAKMDEVKKICD